MVLVMLLIVVMVYVMVLVMLINGVGNSICNVGTAFAVALSNGVIVIGISIHLLPLEFIL